MSVLRVPIVALIASCTGGTGSAGPTPTTPVSTTTSFTFSTIAWTQTCSLASPVVATHPSRLQVLDGPALLAGVRRVRRDVPVGTWQGCTFPGVAPRTVVGDVNADGAADIGLTCDNTVFQLVDGASLAGGAYLPLACVTDVVDWSVLEDLDHDRSPEIGFTEVWNLGYSPQWVRPSGSLPGDSAAADGAWQIEKSTTDYGPQSPLDAGDVDGDHVGDVVTLWMSSSSPHVLHLDVWSGAALTALPAGGTLAAPIARIEGTDRLYGFSDVGRAGDLDGDGLEDLAVVTVDLAGADPGRVRIVFGAQLGTIDLDSAPVVVGTGGGPQNGAEFARVGDVDGDGLDDLAVLVASGGGTAPDLGEIAVVPGSAIAGAAAGTEISVGPYALQPTGTPTWLVACDLDGDGLPELLTTDEVWAGTNLAPGAVRTAEQQAYLYESACVGDLDGVPGDELVEMWNPSGYH